jgi:hypothetical protein
MSEQPNSGLPTRTTRNDVLLKKLNLRRDEEDILIQLDFRFAHYKSQISQKLLSVEQIDTWLSDASISVRSRMIIIEALLKREAKPNTWHYKVPIFSVFYEIFFDKTVDVESIKSILELFGIMSALLFSIVVAVTTTRNYEDLADAIERWDSYNCWIGGSGQIYWFIDVMAISMATSFAAFIFILFTYAVVVSSEFEGEENVASWWFYNRWAVFFSLLMLSISVLSLFAAFGNYVQWNVPNALLENEPCNSSMIISLDNVWGQFNCIINVTVGISVLLALSINSLAIAANHNNGVLWKTTSA